MKKLLGVIVLSLLVSSCSKGEQSYPMDPDDKRREKHGKLTGEGIKLWSTDEDKGGGGGSGIGVNSFLWRASLDTLSFMPLSSVDPHGGVIITDWYENPEAKGERFKVNVIILGTELRADGVRVSAFKQVRGNGGWQDAAVGKDVARDLEDKILTRARELRVKSN